MIIAEYDAVGRVTGTDHPYRLRYLQIVRVRDRQITLSRDYMHPLGSAQLLGGLPELLAQYGSDEKVTTSPTTSRPSAELSVRRSW